MAFFSFSILIGFLGVALMFGSAVVFEQNLRRMGKAGWRDLTRPGGEESTGNPLEHAVVDANSGSAPGSGATLTDCLAVDIGGTKMAAALVDRHGSNCRAVRTSHAPE